MFVTYISKAKDVDDEQMSIFIQRCISAISSQLKGDDTDKRYRAIIRYIAEHFGSLEVEIN